MRFTTPYVQIEGVFATRDASLTVADVDRPGTTIATRRGSAYDLYPHPHHRARNDRAW